MSKLTTERAQQRIAHLKQWQEQRGLTLREEEYLEALQGYLPVLEKQERGESEWIEWGGGECPVDEDAIVEMKWKYGDQITNRAGNYQWSYYEYGDRIIAYRIIQEGQQ